MSIIPTYKTDFSCRALNTANFYKSWVCLSGDRATSSYLGDHNGAVYNGRKLIGGSLNTWFFEDDTKSSRLLVDPSIIDKFRPVGPINPHYFESFSTAENHLKVREAAKILEEDLEFAFVNYDEYFSYPYPQYPLKCWREMLDMPVERGFVVQDLSINTEEELEVAMTDLEKSRKKAGEVFTEIEKRIPAFKDTGIKREAFLSLP